MNSSVIVVDAAPTGDEHDWITSMEYVHRVTTVSGWAAALSSPEFPAATVLLACLGTGSDAVASIVRTCRAVGSLVVVDASRHDEGTVRVAVAAGARRWDGSADTAPSAFRPGRGATLDR